MTNEQIKSEVDHLYDVIDKANNRLAELSAICKHEHTAIGKHTWKIETTNMAGVCDYCRQMVGFHIKVTT